MGGLDAMFGGGIDDMLFFMHMMGGHGSPFGGHRSPFGFESESEESSDDESEFFQYPGAFHSGFSAAGASAVPPSPRGRESTAGGGRRPNTKRKGGKKKKR